MVCVGRGVYSVTTTNENTLSWVVVKGMHSANTISDCCEIVANGIDHDLTARTVCVHDVLIS